MQYLVDGLNRWGEPAPGLAWSMFWQSSLLIGLVLLIEWGLRRKLRAAVRYALWWVVMLKLMLPPSLALPTGLAWWLRPLHSPPPQSRPLQVVVTQGPSIQPSLPPAAGEAPAAPLRDPLSGAGLALGVAGMVSLGLLGWMLVRWHRTARMVRRATLPPEWLENMVARDRCALGLRWPVRLRLVDDAMSPAVCGLVKPVILLPRLLVERLSTGQLRAVLLHELAHLRRGDVWANCVQALLQVVYWWHPLVWLANARIRRVREEAVDDAVVHGLREEAEAYAPTLVEVAKLALQRPLVSLGLVGILESRSFLRQRIERLLEARPPRKAGLTAASALSVLAFGALAVPMGEAQQPAPVAPPASAGDTTNLYTRVITVDLPLLIESMKQRVYLSSTNSEVTVSEALNAFREELGIDFSPPKTIFLTQSSGLLMVRATWSELEKVEKAIVRINSTGMKAQSGVPQPRDESATPVRDGKLLYEQGRLDEAKTRLEEAIKQNPTNQAAYYYLNLIAEAEYKQKPQARDRLTDIMQTSVDDAAVRASAGPASEPPALYTRIFKVNPNTFLSALQETAGLPNNSEGPEIQKALREFFGKIGVDLAAPKTVFLNEPGGSLMVRASLVDLDLIETGIQVLNTAPPQLNLKGAFADVPDEAAAALFQSLGLTNSTWTNVAVVLTAAQARKALDFMQQTPGADLLSECSVTTLSGRQTQVQVVDLPTIVTGLDPQALQPPGVKGGSGYLTTTLPIGPTLDLIPYLAADERTVRLTTIATVTEFLGYYPPTNSLTAYIDGKPQQVTTPLPNFRVRAMTNSVALLDGQTLLMGGPTAVHVSKTKDKVPMLGDLPGVGRFFRSESTTKQTKQLLVFITPTVIDPAGNRLHPEAAEAEPQASQSAR